jgi:hypothetical protein
MSGCFLMSLEPRLDPPEYDKEGEEYLEYIKDKILEDELDAQKVPSEGWINSLMEVR